MIREKSSGQRVVESLVLDALICWPGAAFLMITIGVIHAQVLDAVHPIGYWPSFGLWWVAAAAIGLMRAKPDEWESS